MNKASKNNTAQLIFAWVMICFFSFYLFANLPGMPEEVLGMGWKKFLRWVFGLLFSAGSFTIYFRDELFRKKQKTDKS
ncbi:hypothetical protein [Persicobacter sp. CCB-QB2]|uniref:hypothetical protein n=1 Tax=Persicobacter sp. CCB-QB2 TaxID=1561025 RepID=UPI0006A9A22C|nr:hypothetical protein [Persicobacter sp. CCB-QB2]